MIWNYIKITARTISNNKLYSLINIFGLAIALTISFLMFLWVNDELSVDRFHNNSDRLFLAKRTIPLQNNILDVSIGVSYPMLKSGKESIPEIEEYIPLGRSIEETIVYGDKKLVADGSFTNSAFFKSFSYPVLIGNSKSLDEKIEAILISRSLAERLFGQNWKNETLGQIIDIYNKSSFIVEGVYENFPSNSSMQNEFYYSFEKHLSDNQWMMEWGNNGMRGAFLLAENADPTITSDKLNKLFQDNIGGEVKEGAFLHLFADDYLHGEFDDRAQVSGGRIEYVRIFTIAAFLLLIISCINFINLATVMATNRSGEIGIRKAIGAKQKVLFTQFMVEAGAITLIAIVSALFLAYLILPLANKLTQKSLTFDLSQPRFWIVIFVIYIITTLLSGIYPAVILSSFKPINVLKKKVHNFSRGLSFRKGLVVLQFGLMMVLIISASVVSKQIHYIKNKNLGIEKENLIYIDEDQEITQRYDAVRNELLNSDGISGVTMVDPNPLNMVASTSGVGWPGKSIDEENIEFQIIWTADNFADVFNLEMTEGTYYRPGRKKDTLSIVINEKAVQIMGIDEPIGKIIEFWDRPREIVGVVQDFHNKSLHEEIQPVAFLLDEENAGVLYVKAEQGRTADALKSIESVLTNVAPNFPLRFHFLDETYERIYSSEMLIGKLANYFALISAIISCLGLFGLATFITEQRKKEISIRKVLGASLTSIVKLVSLDFLVLVFLSILIAFPVAWFLMSKWLSNFAYNAELSWVIFLVSGISALVLVTISTGYQAIKAGMDNPAHTLRSE